MKQIKMLSRIFVTAIALLSICSVLFCLGAYMSAYPHSAISPIQYNTVPSSDEWVIISQDDKQVSSLQITEFSDKHFQQGNAEYEPATSFLTSKASPGEKYDCNQMTIATLFDPHSRDNTILITDNNYTVEVWWADKLIAQHNPEEVKKMAQGVGTMLIPLPESTKMEMLTIVFKSPSANGIILPQIYTGTHYELVRTLFLENSITLVSLAVSLFILFSLILLSIIYVKRSLKDKRMPNTIALITLFSIWIFCDSKLSVLLPVNVDIAHLLTFFTLMAVPIAIASLIWFTYGRKYKLVRFIIVGAAANLIIQSVLCGLGIASLNQMLPITHAMILLATASVVFTNVWETRETQDIRSISKPLLVAIVFIVFIFGLVMYWVGDKDSCHNLISITMTVFALIQTAFIVRENRQIEEKIEKELTLKEIYEGLAYEDELTHLLNRRSYEEHIKSIDEKQNRKENRTVLAIFDLNSLKNINDSFGHNAGDNILSVFAEKLHNIYSEYGKCYRIGGDEFAVIADDLGLKEEQKLHAALKNEIMIENLGTELYDIEFSYGSAVLNIDQRTGIGNTAQWKQTADLSLYANKSMNSKEMGDETEVEALKTIITGVIATLEARDQYTAKHSERVNEISMLLAAEMGMSPHTIRDISTAAHFHDIGKIGISDSVLLKPGRLDDDEYEQMKEHPGLGADIIRKSSTMDEIADIIRAHHEKYDGSGYPDGLIGDNIPIGARIIAIADSVDAMMTTRVYRSALSGDVCRGEIQKNLGIMYDPAIGNIALKIWDRIVAIETAD